MLVSHTIPSTPADHSPADRLIFILEGLHQALGRHADAQRLTGRGHIIGPFLMLIWKRVRRIGLRFAPRAAREAAILARNSSRPQAVPKAVMETIIASAARPLRARLKFRPPDPLPRRKAWLLTMIPETAPISGQLRYFLADPEVTAFLVSSPRLCSILNPLCHMLGIQAAGIRPAQALPPPAILNPPPPETLLIAGDTPPQPAPVTVLPCATPPPSPSPSPENPPPEFLAALA